MTKIENKSNDAIFKVKGWLLFICINLIVVNPLWQIINQFNTYTIINSMGLVNAVEGLETLFYIMWISIAFLMFNSIKAGLGLVNVKSGAVETAKKFLRNYAIFFILLYPLTSLISPDYFDLCSDALISSSIKSLVIIGLAYWYLSASKKVKEIYTA
jgi:hypothetical protein